MRKMQLDLDALTVETFETALPAAGRGTVMANAATQNGNNCDGSLADACETGLCTFSPDACPTYYPEYCESANDACPSGRGCTVIDCA